MSYKVFFGASGEGFEWGNNDKELRSSWILAIVLRKSERIYKHNVYKRKIIEPEQPGEWWCHLLK